MQKRSKNSDKNGVENSGGDCTASPFLQILPTVASLIFIIIEQQPKQLGT